MSKVKRHAYESGRQDQFVVRLPDGMRHHLKEMAATNGRSTNSEIVIALKSWVRQQSPNTQNGSVTA